MLILLILQAKGVNDFKKAYAGYNQSADILGFLGKALDVNMALCTRVPPCLPTIMHPPYNEDIHEVRPPYEMDQGQQALYIRPILLADYRNSVLIRGMVIPANASTYQKPIRKGRSVQLHRTATQIVLAIT